MLSTAPQLRSSHERANVLIGVASRAMLAGQARQLYVAASSGLGNHDETCALAASAGAESRP